MMAPNNNLNWQQLIYKELDFNKLFNLQDCLNIFNSKAMIVGYHHIETLKSKLKIDNDNLHNNLLLKWAIVQVEKYHDQIFQCCVGDALLLTNKIKIVNNNISCNNTTPHEYSSYPLIYFYNYHYDQCMFITYKFNDAVLYYTHLFKKIKDLILPIRGILRQLLNRY